jgi:ubiquinone/menaquinone biosynthesis C-methylase UbiE
MVAQAEARNVSAIKGGRVELRHGSVSSLPFADNTVHKAMAVNSMQIWPDPIAGLREIWRVMKSGGTIARNRGRRARLDAADVYRLRSRCSRRS